MWLSDDVFRSVVASAPLVSIDLVVQNSHGQVLLGNRVNRPAQGYWFVPGGRILKGERLDAAFRRLTLSELGLQFERSQSRFLGVYEHMYQDSVFGCSPKEPTTHYVVLAYHVRVPEETTLAPPADQHARYDWWSLAEMLRNAAVHDNSRAYVGALGSSDEKEILLC